MPGFALSLAVMSFWKFWKRMSASFTLLPPNTVVFFAMNESITFVLSAPPDFSVLPPMKSFSRLLSSRA